MLGRGRANVGQRAEQILGRGPGKCWAERRANVGQRAGRMLVSLEQKVVSERPVEVETRSCN